MSNNNRTPKFNIGDTVYLVVGSPAMAVAEHVKEYIDGSMKFNGTYRCQWFAGRKEADAKFPEESLTKTNPKP